MRTSFTQFLMLLLELCELPLKRVGLLCQHLSFLFVVHLCFEFRVAQCLLGRHFGLFSSGLGVFEKHTLNLAVKSDNPHLS